MKILPYLVLFWSVSTTAEVVQFETLTFLEIERREKVTAELKKKKAAHHYRQLFSTPLEYEAYKVAHSNGARGAELAAFLAQCAHESGNYKYTREIHNGSNYEGRKDLGNTMKGFGRMYRGGGLIQITGRYNYERASYDIYGDARLIEYPELTENSKVAVAVSWWFWENRVRPKVKNFSNVLEVTKIINPALKGFKNRRRLTYNYMRNYNDI